MLFGLWHCFVSQATCNEFHTKYQHRKIQQTEQKKKKIKEIAHTVQEKKRRNYFSVGVS